MREHVAYIYRNNNRYIHNVNIAKKIAEMLGDLLSWFSVHMGTVPPGKSNRPIGCAHRNGFSMTRTEL